MPQKIFVTAKTRAHKASIERIDETHFIFPSEAKKNEENPTARSERFIIKVTEPPVDGKANKAIQKALAGQLGIPPSKLELSSGASSSHKIFTVLL